MTEEPKETKRKARSIDEIMSDIELISQDAEHRDQFKALRMLASEKAASVTLPPPMEDHEVIERLARLQKGYGINVSRIAFKVAFPNAKEVDELEPTVIPAHLSEQDRITIQHCTSIKALHRHFPQIKRRGLHPGYPRKSGREAQQKWCREQATKILVDRHQARMKTVEKRDVGLDTGAQLPGLPETHVEG